MKTQETTKNQKSKSDDMTVPLPRLNPVTQKVVERCIEEVLEEYTEKSKFFTADTLHYIRTKITERVHERLGDEEIHKIDVLLDLSAVEDIRFGFRVLVPQDKAEDHILNSVELDDDE